MSDLQKKWAKAKISTAMHAMAPPPPLPEFSELDEDRYSSGSVPNTPQDDDSSSASSMSSTGTVIPSPGRALFARPQGFPSRSFDPIPWTTYFERELFLASPDGSITYHAYLTSPAPSSGPGKAPGPLFVTHHGAGSSGLSFAVLGSEIRKRMPSAGILSLDARGHGLTTTSPDSRDGGGEEPGPEDLTLPTLAADLLAVLTLTKSAMHWPTLPPLILVGHSLGGAVVTEFASVLLPSLSKPPQPSPPPPPPAAAAAASQKRAAPPAFSSLPHPLPTNSTTALSGTRPPAAGGGRGGGGGATAQSSSDAAPATATALGAAAGVIDLLGYAVLDVVEGSAMDALQSMHAYLATRPAGFETLRDGVEWHVRSRTVRNAVSARASVPGLLVHVHQPPRSGEEVAEAGAEAGEGEQGEAGVGTTLNGVETEKDGRSLGGVVVGGGGARGRGRGGSGSRPWRWRTDLARTQPFWEGWFSGLSKKFLAGRGGKMLLLAGTDRLDTELTIGQMQGKYALQVFPEAGHFIHEDLPEKTAMALVDFHRRNDRSALVLPPKVSELLAQGKKV